MKADTGLGFGKYADIPWTRVPVSYLRWLVNSRHPQITRAELEINRRGTVLPTMEITGHAIDRVSALFIKKWRTTRQPDEGIHTWLHRTAELALRTNRRDNQGRVIHEDMLFAFADENQWPVLKTVMMNPGFNPGTT